MGRSPSSVLFQEYPCPSSAAGQPRWHTPRSLWNPTRLRVGPLPTAPEILINFRGGPRTFPWVPYYRVLRGEVGSEVFSGKIVLIGATSPLLHDLFPTVFAGSGDMPRIQIHATG